MPSAPVARLLLDSEPSMGKELTTNVAEMILLLGMLLGVCPVCLSVEILANQHTPFSAVPNINSKNFVFK